MSVSSKALIISVELLTNSCLPLEFEMIILTVSLKLYLSGNVMIKRPVESVMHDGFSTASVLSSAGLTIPSISTFTPSNGIGLSLEFMLFSLTVPLMVFGKGKMQSNSNKSFHAAESLLAQFSLVSFSGFLKR